MEGSVLADAKRLVQRPGAVVRRLSRDDLLKHGGILACSTVMAGGLNYGFQFMMARVLSPATLGVFGSLFAVFYLVNVLGLGVQLSTTRFTSASADGLLAGLHGGLLVRAIGFGLLVGGGLVLASPLVGELLGLTSTWPLIIIAATIPLTFAFRTNRGTYQGRELFGLLGSYNVFFAGSKLLFGIGLVLLGFGIEGAFGGIVIATLLVALVTTLHLRSRLPGRGVSLRSGTQDYRSVYAFLSPALVAGFCLNVPANVDVIILKATLEQNHLVGEYVMATVLGKVLIFLPLGISKAMFPKISDDGEADSAAERALLRRALLYAGAITGTGALAFWMAPDLILEILFDGKYAGAAPLVRWYGVAVAPFAVSIVILNYELASDRTQFVSVFAAATLAAIGLMWAAGGERVRVIQVLVGVYSCLAVYGIYHITNEFRQ